MNARRHRSLRRTICALAVSLALGTATEAIAREESLPVNIQAVLLKKILGYDRALEGKPVKVLVVEADDTGEADRVAAAMREVGLSVSTAKAANAPSTLHEASVAYLLPGSVTPAIKELCVKLHVLTVSPRTSTAKEGDVSIGLGKKPDGRPEIVVHLRRSKDEGHALSSNLLSVVTVVQ